VAGLCDRKRREGEAPGWYVSEVIERIRAGRHLQSWGAAAPALQVRKPLSKQRLESEMPGPSQI
jgi:hypothetical protein